MDNFKFGNITSDGLPPVIPGPGLERPENSKLLFRKRTERYYIILYIHRKFLGRAFSGDPYPRRYSDTLKLQIIDLKKRKERWIEKPAMDYCDREGSIAWDKSIPSVLSYMLNPLQTKDSHTTVDKFLLSVSRSLEVSLKGEYEEFRVSEMKALMICSHCDRFYDGPLAHLNKKVKFCSTDCRRFYKYVKKHEGRK